MATHSDAGVDKATAEKIVKRLIASVPMFRRPKDLEEFTDLVESWQQSLNMATSTYPSNIYLEAVSLWLSEATSDTRQPMPGDIIKYCKKVMDRIATDPVRGPKMKAWVEARREARIQALIEGRA